MSEAVKGHEIAAELDREPPRLLGIFAPWRLNLYGCVLAAVYMVLLVGLFRAGVWIEDDAGTPILADFAAFWIAGTQALHGDVASLYDPVAYASMQVALVGPDHPSDRFYANWQYPPILPLVLAPFATLPYPIAFLTWQLVTLLGCLLVIYLIVRQRPAIALVLGSPLTAWNVYEGHTGFLTATLLGAALLVLERQPVLAGVFIGCLAYKPQFGMLFPVALAASKQWRAFASSATTIVLLVGVSIAACGMAVWEALPREIAATASEYLSHENPIGVVHWVDLQTIYGLVRALHGGAALAWLVQGIATTGVAVIVWMVWRSSVRYDLKAATLSAAALIVIPYARAYDMAAIAIPVAFLARDQMRCGLLRGEQTMIIALFVACLMILVSGGNRPIGPIVMITLFYVILRRDPSCAKDATFHTQFT